MKGTYFANHGRIARHDVTGYGLGRLVVESEGRFPELELWMRMLEQNGKVVVMYHYSERVGRAFSGFLWLFYK